MEQLNPLDSLLKWYVNPDTREYLHEYYAKACKQAVEQGHKVDVFFNACYRGVEYLKRALLKDSNPRRQELREMIIAARRRAISFGKENIEPYDVACENLIVECKEELEYLKTNFATELSFHTKGRYQGPLTMQVVEYLEAHLNQAKNVVLLTKLKEALDSIEPKENQSRARLDEQVAGRERAIHFSEKVYTVLEVFFHENDRNQLRTILSGGIRSSDKLLFNDAGNRLAFALKEFYQKDKITGMSKVELEYWIKSNFKYLYRGTSKEYTSKYLNDIVSSNKKNCKNPINID